MSKKKNFASQNFQFGIFIDQLEDQSMVKDGLLMLSYEQEWLFSQVGVYPGQTKEEILGAGRRAGAKYSAADIDFLTSLGIFVLTGGRYYLTQDYRDSEAEEEREAN